MYFFGDYFLKMIIYKYKPAEDFVKILVIFIGLLFYIVPNLAKYTVR